MRFKAVAVSLLLAGALAAAPLTSASAREFHHGRGILFGLFGLGAAAVTAAALVATAPFVALAGAPPGYYAPPPGYYYPPQGYYAPPPGYYPPPTYYAPPAYYAPR
jgi:hypothetical protein